MTLSCSSKQAADTVPEAAALRFSTGIAGAGARIGTGGLVLLLFLPGNHPSSSRLAVRGGAAVVLVLRLRLCGCGRRRTVEDTAGRDIGFLIPTGRRARAIFGCKIARLGAVLQRLHIFRIGEVRRFQPLMDWEHQVFPQNRSWIGGVVDLLLDIVTHPNNHRRYNKE